jgi:hypothetical protein
VDEEAVAFARRGLYPENILSALTENQKAQFFEKAEHALDGVTDGVVRYAEDLSAILD